MLPGLSKKFGSMRHSISSVVSMCRIARCLRGSSKLRIPDIRTSGGNSAFPDQRMARFRSRFQYAENTLLCPSGAKRAQIAGILEDCWLKFVNLRIRKTEWWCRQSRENRSLTAVSLLTGNLTGKSRDFGLWCRPVGPGMLHNSLCLATATDHRNSKRTGNFFEITGN